eukprot:11906139-Karenia_brevis.AAC.1
MNEQITGCPWFLNIDNMDIYDKVCLRCYINQQDAVTLFSEHGMPLKALIIGAVELRRLWMGIKSYQNGTPQYEVFDKYFNKQQSAHTCYSCARQCILTFITTIMFRGALSTGSTREGML